MAGKRSTVYSGDAITFTFAAMQIESGRGPDEFLRVEQQNDDVSYAAGLDGEGVFNELLDRHTLVTCTLMQTSAGNNLLSAYHVASKKAGVLPAPIYVEDRKGNSLFVSDAAVIKKTPDMTFGKESDVVTWEFLVHDPESFVGGH